MKQEQKEIYNNASLLRKGSPGTVTDDERLRSLPKMFRCGKVSSSIEGRMPLEIALGEHITATKTGLLEKQKVNPDEYVGWKDDISVSFRQPELSRITFTGSFRCGESSNAFIDTLSTRTGAGGLNKQTPNIHHV